MGSYLWLSQFQPHPTSVTGTQPCLETEFVQQWDNRRGFACNQKNGGKGLENISGFNGVRTPFPDSLKIAKVIPIFKTDDPSNFSNYRPISILSCLSKILEKLVHSRLSKFLTKFEILNHHQYGFRQHHSTYMAVLQTRSVVIFSSTQKYIWT